MALDQLVPSPLLHDWDDSPRVLAGGAPTWVVRYLAGDEEVSGSRLLGVNSGGTAHTWQCRDVVRMEAVIAPTVLDLTAADVHAAFTVIPTEASVLTDLHIHTDEQSMPQNRLGFAAVTGHVAGGRPVHITRPSWTINAFTASSNNSRDGVGGEPMDGFGYALDARAVMTLGAEVGALKATADIHATFALEE